MNFLIWQTAYLGDVVLATPLIETLRFNFPSARLGFVGRPFIRELFEGMGLDLIPFSKTLGESIRILKKIKDYDVAVVPHRSLRTALIMLFSGIPTRIGFDRSEFPLAFTHRVKHRWELHEVDRNLELLKPLGVKKIVRETRLHLPQEEKEGILKKFGLKEGSYIVVNPFSNFPLKEWSLKNWADLLKRFKDLRIVVTGLKEDIQKASILEREVSFVNLVGKTSLRELMGVLAGAKFVISNDSSPVHIANALGVPAFTVYTATSPDYGFYPLKGGYISNPAPCSPCSPNPKRCRRRDKICLSLPSPELVFERLKETFDI